MTLGLVCYRNGARRIYYSDKALAKELKSDSLTLEGEVTEANEQSIDKEWFPAGFPDSRRKFFGSDAIACSDLPPYDPKPYSIAMFVVVLVFAFGVAALLVMSLLRGRV